MESEIIFGFVGREVTTAYSVTVDGHAKGIMRKHESYFNDGTIPEAEIRTFYTVDGDPQGREFTDKVQALFVMFNNVAASEPVRNTPEKES